MRTSRRPARAGFAVICGGLVTAATLSGCGSTHPGAGATAGSGASTSPGSQAPRAGTTAPATAQPPGGPVPGGFAAASVTFVSPGEAFVLGTAPCAHAPCTSIVRTLDRGVSWRGLPAPVVPLGYPGREGQSAGPAVWGIRFATSAHGFVFGTGLWETTDGGEHWAPAAYLGGSILSLAAIDGQLLALTAACSPQAGCTQFATLARRPLAGGPWHQVTQVRASSPALDQTDLIATQAQVAAVLDGTSVVVTSDGGLTSARYPAPCTVPGTAEAASVAVIAPRGLALLCAGQGYTGHRDKTVYLSSDLGAHWTKAGPPASSGDPFTIAAATPAQLVVAAASAASWLYYSGDQAAQWRTVYTADDGGLGWADLGFTTVTDGVVIHGPVLTDRNQEDRPGELLLTSDGGAAWQQIRF